MFDLITDFGYTGIFFTIIGEVGFMLFPLPGDTLLFSTGLLTHSGKFSYWPLVTVVFFGSVIAGHIGYYLGTLVDKETLINNKYYKIKDEHLHKTEKFFDKYGVWAIMASRFVPMARSFLSQLLGIIGYDKKKFFLYNAIASALWPLIIVTAGMILGDMFPNSLRYIEITVAILLALVLIPMFKEIMHQVGHQINIRKKKLDPNIDIK